MNYYLIIFVISCTLVGLTIEWLMCGRVKEFKSQLLFFILGCSSVICAVWSGQLANIS